MYVLVFLCPKLNEPGFHPLDRVNVPRTGRFQIGRYLLDFRSGDSFEVAFLAEMKEERSEPSTNDT